jgi:hypothetical protein
LRRVYRDKHEQIEQYNERIVKDKSQAKQCNRILKKPLVDYGNLSLEYFDRQDHDYKIIHYAKPGNVTGIELPVDQLYQPGADHPADQ